jgi:DNA-binding NarL/FixJ family response regulator
MVEERQEPQSRGGGEASTAPARVLIADDQELVRGGIRRILESDPAIEIVAEASDGLEAADLAARAHPDVAVLDIKMPGLDGIEATERIVGAPGASPRVLILTTYGSEEYVYRALRAGASGFVLKDAGAEALVDAVRVVAAGEALLDASVTRSVIEEFVRRSPEPRPARTELDQLTKRELEVLGLIADGQSNAEIAATLVVSAATVKTHVAHVLMKLGVRDRAQAVIYAYESGLITPGESRSS